MLKDVNPGGPEPLESATLGEPGVLEGQQRSGLVGRSGDEHTSIWGEELMARPSQQLIVDRTTNLSQFLFGFKVHF